MRKRNPGSVAKWIADRRTRIKNDPIYKAKLQKQHRLWKQTHKEQTRIYGRRAYAKRPEVFKAYNKKWMRLHKNDPTLKMIHRQRSRINKVLKRAGITKDRKSLELIGCTATQLKEYISSKFLPGMTWGNHGLFGWHVDHITPLASFDFTDSKQIEAAFHYTNLQPLWWFDNLSKADKIA